MYFIPNLSIKVISASKNLLSNLIKWFNSNLIKYFFPQFNNLTIFLLYLLLFLFISI